MARAQLRHVSRGNQADYLLGTRAHGWDGFDVVRFHGLEAISSPFRYEVTLVRAADRGSVDLGELVDAPATLAIACEGRWRLVHGILAEAARVERTSALTIFRVLLVPHLWRARVRQHCRNFVDRTLKEIVAGVLENRLPDGSSGRAGLVEVHASAEPPPAEPDFSAFAEPSGSFRWALSDQARITDRALRSYVVQYNEPDLDFVSRLLEEEGLSYFFEHAASELVMTITDRPGRTALFESDERYVLRGGVHGGGGMASRQVLQTFTDCRRMRSGEVGMRDYDWPRSRTLLEDTVAAEPRTTHSASYFEFPARDEAVRQDPCRHPALVRLERFAVERRLAAGTGTVRTMQPGYRFAVEDDLGGSSSDEHLAVSVETFANQLELPETVVAREPFGLDGGLVGEPSHEIRFEALPASVPFRPARRTPRPRIDGVQTALVTAEEHGRGGRSQGGQSASEIAGLAGQLTSWAGQVTSAASGLASGSSGSGIAGLVGGVLEAAGRITTAASRLGGGSAGARTAAAVGEIVSAAGQLTSLAARIADRSSGGTTSGAVGQIVAAAAEISGVVVGIAGGGGPEINANEHGQVRVRFPWDQTPNDGTPTSCWIRVSHAWGGGGFGGLYTPRVGHEVLVAYLQGDPDRPVIVGRVYNAQTPPPYDQQARPTLSTIRSDSFGGTGGFNELRFDDATSREQIYAHAQRDYDEQVNHDHRTNVGNDQTDTVGHDQTNTVGHDQRITVQHDRFRTVHRDETTVVDHDQSTTVHHDRSIQVDHYQTTRVNENRSATVGKNDTIEVGESRAVTVGQDATVGVRGNRSIQVEGSNTLTANEQAQIRVGASTITITDTNITLDSGAGARIALVGDMIVISGAQLFVHASGPNDIKGRPIKLNCAGGGPGGGSGGGPGGGEGSDDGGDEGERDDEPQSDDEPRDDVPSDDGPRDDVPPDDGPRDAADPAGPADGAEGSGGTIRWRDHADGQGASAAGGGNRLDHRFIGSDAVGASVERWEHGDGDPDSSS